MNTKQVGIAIVAGTVGVLVAGGVVYGLKKLFTAIQSKMAGG